MSIQSKHKRTKSSTTRISINIMKKNFIKKGNTSNKCTFAEEIILKYLKFYYYLVTNQQMCGIYEFDAYGNLYMVLILKA